MSMPLAVVLEGTVEAECQQVEKDELHENSGEIAAALRTLGYRVEIVACSLDMGSLREQLARLKPGVVFNLVDSIEGKGNLISMAPLLLAHMDIPFTGGEAMPTAITSDKPITKQILRAHGIPTPGWLSETQVENGSGEITFPCILKSISEDASFGMFADSVVSDRAELKSRWQEKKQKYGTEWFAEEYIDGREFNVAALASDNPRHARVFPPAEIVFNEMFPKDKPKIVDYAAKWYADTAEYKGTVRSFEFGPKDDALLEQLRETTLACWDAFGLTGYARVDYRVDARGRPYVLEINTNPFLTEGEGMGVAAARAGVPFTQLIRAIVADAYRRSRVPVPEVLAA